MKKVFFLAVIVLFIRASTTGQSLEFPQAEISNDILHARLYLPDAEKGYYRGTRFDWSGSVGSLETNGHTYFGQWFTRYDPKVHDSITGPVEDYAPLNYTEAKPGETFVKIGIGVLKRLDDQQYKFSAPYELLDTGKWAVRSGPDFVEYRHELADPKSGYAYVYTKTVRLTAGKPQMTIEHALKNTGTKAGSTVAQSEISGRRRSVLMCGKRRRNTQTGQKRARPLPVRRRDRRPLCRAFS